ncbi:MAG: ATP-binding protein [Bacteroidota bacterium]|nr:ATP-binding protein [Bacteroidota bacterium]
MSDTEQWDDLRNKIIGLGELSSRKNYYPEFQNNMVELERFKSLLDKTADAIFQANAINGEIVGVNDAAVQMLQCSKGELFNMSIYQFFPADISQKIQTFCSTYAGEQEKSLYLQSAIGVVADKKSHIELVAQVVEFNNSPYLVIIARDISERIEAETRLKYSENKLRTIFDSTSDAIFIYDIDGKIIEVNNSMLQMYQISRKEALTYPITAYTDTSVLSSYQLDLYERISNGAETTVEWKARRPLTNEAFDVEVALKRMEWRGKMLIISTVRDITARKAAEKELAESYMKIQRINDELTIAKEKAEVGDQLKTAFLQNISHEIRTPMNAIVGFANLLNESDVTPDKQQEFTQIILQSSKQLLSIITDIVNIASIETGQEKVKETEVNLNWILQHLYEQFALKAQKQNLEFKCEMESDNEEIYIIIDETKLTQVLSNLLGNALKFTQKGEVVFGYKTCGNELEFYVKDTGIGIPPEMHEEVFKRFRQLSTSTDYIYGGSGLGLSISKAYVELMGGRIWLTSEPGHGSIFYFTVPFRRVGEFLPSGNVTEVIPGKNYTVLVVEDEEYNYRVLYEMLKLANFTIIRAENGLEAVEKCQLLPQIDLVLMDLKMPVMDGYEATRQIRKQFPDLPVIAQTAYAHDINKNKALQAGFSDYICKPIDISDLFTKIREQLEKDRSAL